MSLPNPVLIFEDTIELFCLQHYRGANITFESLCSIMTDESRGDTIQRYADVNTFVMDTLGQRCLNIRYDQRASSLNRTSYGAGMVGICFKLNTITDI